MSNNCLRYFGKDLNKSELIKVSELSKLLAFAFNWAHFIDSSKISDAKIFGLKFGLLTLINWRNIAIIPVPVPRSKICLISRIFFPSKLSCLIFSLK